MVQFFCLTMYIQKYIQTDRINRNYKARHFAGAQHKCPWWDWVYICYALKYCQQMRHGDSVKSRCLVWAAIPLLTVLLPCLAASVSHSPGLPLSVTRVCWPCYVWGIACAAALLVCKVLSLSRTQEKSDVLAIVHLCLQCDCTFAE